MRITNQMKREQLMIDMSRLQSDIFTSQGVLNSGKEVQRPSDNPAAARKIMMLRASEERREQHKENITDGIARLSYAESQLRGVSDLLIEARQIIIQGSNGAIHDDDREALAQRADQMVYELLTLANARHEDQYIFGGFNTQEAPYSLVEDPDPDDDDVVAVQALPLNMDETIYRIAADGQKVPANIPGNLMFQPGAQGDDDDLFQTLIDLRDALRDGILNDNEQDPPLDPADPAYDPTDPVWLEPEYDSMRVIQQSLGRLDNSLERVRGQMARVGGIVQRLQNTEERHMDLQILESEHRSEAQDADLTEWITKFQMQTIALQQAMQVGGQVLQASLVNFIR